MPLCQDTPTLTWDASPSANAYVVAVRHGPGVRRRTTTPTSPSTTRSRRGSRSSTTRPASPTTGASRPASTCPADFASTWLAAASSAAAHVPQGLGRRCRRHRPAAQHRHLRPQRSLRHRRQQRDVRRGRPPGPRQPADLPLGRPAAPTPQQAGIQSNQEARNYRLQYTTTGDWLTATSVDVDATHWTKTGRCARRTVATTGGSPRWTAAATCSSWSRRPDHGQGHGRPDREHRRHRAAGPDQPGQPRVRRPGHRRHRRDPRPAPGRRRQHPRHPRLAEHRPDHGDVHSRTTRCFPARRSSPWVTSAVVDLAGNSAQASPITATVDPTVDSLAPTITHDLEQGQHGQGQRRQLRQGSRRP